MAERFELILNPGKSKYAFGCRKEDVIATLEDMLARVKDGRLIPQKMELHHKAPMTDYALKTLVVVVAEPITGQVEAHTPMALTDSRG